MTGRSNTSSLIVFLKDSSISQFVVWEVVKKTLTFRIIIGADLNCVVGVVITAE